jgi:predicted ATPase/DNA-binding winged helix-turn-helix (wHTH) protein
MDAAEAPAAIEFGRFSVLPRRRELLADGRPLDLGGRAFDALMVLIEASGAVVSKDALMRRIWPDRIVEENSLHAQIAALRRAFGADRDLVRTVARRGYQFTGEIRTVSASPAMPATVGMPQPAGTLSRPPTNLPEPISELIGRDAELDAILDISTSHRLVTLTGTGGIGKTRLGFAAARRRLPGFADGVWAVELAPLSDPELVPVIVATSLGLELASGAASPPSVANALRSKQLLLVLDNCEHVVDAAARMAEALLRANSAVQVIATSREPLRIEGEWVYTVPPLAVPLAGSPESEDPLLYGAVLLFVERARAAVPSFSPDARVAATIAGICRRLDGIPLAIELAAARAAPLGIEGLAVRLDDRFRLLAGGYRTAMPRQQTLRATLDWSYELLTEPERVALRRLAVFAGGFTLATASAVAADDAIAASEIADCVANLVAKSLVTKASGGGMVRYRLLETTRAYVLEKLVEAGEFDSVARRHAERYRDLFENAEAEAAARPTDEWLAEYGPRIDNVRAALDWAFSPNGDVSLGVALSAAAVPLWVHLSLMEECRSRVEQALSALAPGAGPDPRCEMKLHAALGASQVHTGAVTDPEIGAAWKRTLEIAESLGDAEYQLRSLLGLWFLQTASGRHRAARALAQSFCSLAAKEQSDPNDLLIGERMIGISQYYLGDHSSARRRLEHVLAHYLPVAQKSHIIRFQSDQQVPARVVLARVLWLLGFPDQAMRAAQSSIADARAANHTNSLCYALSQAACPIALLVGDLAAAEHYVEMLLDHATSHALALWQAWGRIHQGVLVIQRGQSVTGLRLLRAGLNQLGEAKFAALKLVTSLMAEALAGAGQIADGLAMIEEAIARSEHSEEHWLVTELSRVKGELLLLQGAPRSAEAAEGHFRQALDGARQQGALSWELRAATSLARLLSGQGRSVDATALLQPVYDRFTEGFATADLRAAKALLDVLA